jgi:hypothetical protein
MVLTLGISEFFLLSPSSTMDIVQKPSNSDYSVVSSYCLLDFDSHAVNKHILTNYTMFVCKSSNFLTVLQIILP